MVATKAIACSPSTSHRSFSSAGDSSVTPPKKRKRRVSTDRCRTNSASIAASVACRGRMVTASPPIVVFTLAPHALFVRLLPRDDVRERAGIGGEIPQDIIGGD